MQGNKEPATQMYAPVLVGGGGLVDVALGVFQRFPGNTAAGIVTIEVVIVSSLNLGLATRSRLWYNSMMDLLILQKLGMAVVLGALIGLEREQKYQRYSMNEFGGVRTFALIGLLGALSYILSTSSIVYFGVLTAGFLGLLVASYVVSASRENGVGATSEVASILVYVIGILCGMGMWVVSTVVALVVLTILHFRTNLHRLAKHLKDEELVSTIQFIAVAFVVLPILPDVAMGPYGFFNPYKVWKMVVLVSGLSYLSYIAIKIFGSRRGVGITGFLAGFVSSTAVTMTFSEQSKKNDAIVNPYVVATVVASTAVFFRVLAEVSAVYPPLLNELYVPMLSMGMMGLLIVLFFWFKKDNQVDEAKRKMEKMESPFTLKPALQFGIFFTVIMFVTKYAGSMLGESGYYLSSFLSGFVDIDAITLQMSDLAKNGLNEMVAVTSILIVTVVNTLTKAGIFLAFGGRKVALRVLASFVLIVAAGGISLFFL